jgi:hypothetical protein
MPTTNVRRRGMSVFSVRSIKLWLAVTLAVVVTATAVGAWLNARATSSAEAVAPESSRPQDAATWRALKVRDPLPTTGRFAAVARVTHMDLGEAQLVGSFPAEQTATGATLYRVPTTDDRECLLLVDSGISWTCLRGSLFELRDVAFLVTFEGGTSADDLRSQRVVGIVASNVGNLSAVYENGETFDVPVGASGAFMHAVPASELTRRNALASLVAHDAAGQVVEKVRVGS